MSGNEFKLDRGSRFVGPQSIKGNCHLKLAKNNWSLIKCLYFFLIGAFASLSADRVIKQKDIPFVAKDPGVYILCQDISFSAKKSKKCTAAITIVGKNIVLQGRDHSIDLKNSQGTGILITEEASDIVINNVIIKNTGAPEPSDVTPTQPDTPISFEPSTLPEYQAFLRANFNIQNPLPLNNPLSSAGIGIQAPARNISIAECAFYNCFIGISSNGQVHNITIDKCQAFDGGFDYGPSFGVCPLRGGFAIFWNGANPPVHGFTTDNANNIVVSNCTASSNFWQWGISGFWIDDITVKNCNVNNKIANTGGSFEAGIDFTVSGCIEFIYCSNVTILDCISVGGQTGQGIISCLGAYIGRCQSYNFSDHAIDADTASYVRIEDCSGFDSIPTTFSPDHPLNNKGWAISAFTSDHVVIENCVVINNLNPPGDIVFPPPIGSIIIPRGCGIILFASDSVVKNCICEQCYYGILFAGCTQCNAQENTVIGNTDYGLLDIPFPPLPIPNMGNTFYGNQAQDNNGNDIVISPPDVAAIVSTSSIATVGTPVVPWVNLTP